MALQQANSLIAQNPLTLDDDSSTLQKTTAQKEAMKKIRVTSTVHMPRKKGVRCMTFLLTGKSNKALQNQIKSLEGKVFDSHVMQFRALIVTNNIKAMELETGVEVHESKAGDQSQDSMTWVSQTIVDELRSEYVAKPRVAPAKAKKVITEWEKARKARVVAEAEVLKARIREEKACRMRVRHLGIGPIDYKGDTFDPAFRGETVYYLKRRTLQSLENEKQRKAGKDVW